ncbi:MAG: hydroxymethylbilane synthase [Cyanobacteria bacterium]|nr:hydroxymethylbilane synthase [Cyanobacteriota bacterium]
MPPFEKNRLVVGSRKSRLALWQSEHVIELLQRAWPDVVLEIRTYTTEGDANVLTALPEIGGKGVFTTQLEEALAAEEIDLAVHSLKDLPVDIGRELMIGAISSRIDPRDCLVARDARTIATLPRGAVVGTSSLRRQGQLLARRPDLAVKPIRGNVDTRVRKVLDGEYDAALLAAAGVTRLGLAAHVTEWIPADAILPAPGQGALAVQCRSRDQETLLRLAAIDEPGARAAVEAEREFLQHLGGGCSAPIAAYARFERGRLCMTGLVASPDGRRVVRVEDEAENGSALARRLAARALDEGAQSILTEFRGRKSATAPAGHDGGLEGRRVVVTRAREEAELLCERLAALGATPICAPAIRIEPVDDLRPLDDAIASIASFDWIVFTSTDAVEIFCQRWTHMGKTSAEFRGIKLAAVGPVTARALAAWGAQPGFVPDEFAGNALAEGLAIVPGHRVLLPRAEIARHETVEILERRGATVVVLPIYRTVAAEIDATVIEDIRRGVDAVLFTSGSTVQHFMNIMRQHDPGFVFPAHARILCIGPVTADAARDAGLRVDSVAEVHTTEGLVDSLVGVFAKGAVAHGE